MSGAARACLYLGGLFALAALAWMAFLPAVVEHELSEATGFDIRVGILAANPFTGRIVVRRLTAGNPPGFPAPGFVELREFRAMVDVFSWFFTDRIVIDELDVDLRKIEIVRQHDGRSNAGEFMASFSRGGQTAPEAQAPPPRKPARYLVRKLRIRLEKLVIADYSGGKADQTEYPLNIDHTYANVSDARQLLAPEVVRSLRSFGLHHDAAQLLPGEFGRALGAAVGGAAQLGAKVKDAGQQTGQYLKGLFEKLEQSAKP